MKTGKNLCCGLAIAVSLFSARVSATEPLSSVRTALQQLAIDPTQTYRVRELQLARGDIKIYLTEGVLAFATPVNGRRIAAVFTTDAVEAGDGEVLVLPPTRSERASLARFAGTPNLDEHIGNAVFFFGDDTAQELLEQIHAHSVHNAPDIAAQLADSANAVLRGDAAQLYVRIADALFDDHLPGRNFFYGMMSGRQLGTFDVVYEPDDLEPVSVGRVAQGPDGRDHLQIWTSFRPREAAAFAAPLNRISDYRLDTTIRSDLSMQSIARFHYSSRPEDGRVIDLHLAARLRATSATVDGQAAEVVQHDSARTENIEGAVNFLVVAQNKLQPGVAHDVEVRYEGSVIRQNARGYFVDDRNAWYPFTSPLLTAFDLTFHCPANLHLVSTGEPVSDEVANGIRTVHRRTIVPEALAGFNLGEYLISAATQGPYRIEVYSNASATPLPDLASQTASILAHYTKLWNPLPIHSLAVSPIEGYFGQGFPGLIYLSNMTYLRDQDRPSIIRTPRLDSFFSEMLLPHEIAHQWWGNIVIQSDYRSAWLLEAMANCAALQYLESSQGPSAVSAVLSGYRDELIAEQKGHLNEEAGPVILGQRLLASAGLGVWHDIIYDKGTWILEMLRQRLGQSGFHQLQLNMLREFGNRPISNEDFRSLAASLVPPDQPDRSLSVFFDAWVYSTGIPRMKLVRNGKLSSLQISGVDDDFTLDVPLTCKVSAGKRRTVWIRATSGETPVDAENCALPNPGEFLYRY